MKRGFLFILFILLAVNVSAQECFPEYKCGMWQDCIEGLQSRVCVDDKCNSKDIIERRFCEDLNCVPNIKCTEWTGCFYTDRVEDLFMAKIKFGGYKTRECVDSANCVDSFSEEGVCDEVFDLDIKEVKYCGRDYVSINDPLSKKEIAKINLESWKKNRLDMTFSSGTTKYCPSCFNGLKDENEEQIDCGGDCRLCKKERQVPLFLLVVAFWGLTLIFSMLLIREFVVSRNAKNNNIKEKTKSRLK